jgi:hypothetical protein
MHRRAALTAALPPLKPPRSFYLLIIGNADFLQKLS